MRTETSLGQCHSILKIPNVCQDRLGILNSNIGKFEKTPHVSGRLSGAPHATATMGSVVDSRSSGRHTHASFVPGFCADAIRRLDALATGSSDSQRCVRQALEELEFEPEEWADGWALFEEGASRAAMQD